MQWATGAASTISVLHFCVVVFNYHYVFIEFFLPLFNVQGMTDERLLHIFVNAS